jgi:NTP-dependent ternary system trypsin peptidase co-occuring protein
MEIELADAVAALRDELVDAAARGVASGLSFVVGPIELEFAVELKRDAKIKTGFKAWVVSADAEGGIAHGRTHRVKMSLTPKSADGGDVLVSGPNDRATTDPGDVSEHIPG